MKSIGGYFELELRKETYYPHSGCVLVNSGRNALEYILRVLKRKPDVVWIPYYTCDVMLQPLRRLNIRYEFYHINDNLEVAEWPSLGENDYIVVNNYFGIKDSYIESLVNRPKLSKHLIIDNSQAWYAKEYLGIREFYSPRKFFGVPDGGVAWTPVSKEVELGISTSYDSCRHLLKRVDLGAQAGYQDYRNNEDFLDNQLLKSMSNLTRALIENIDYEWVKMKRRENYEQLSYHLNASNLLKLPDFNSFECPMVYPFMSDDESLRQKLIDNRIFIATYWSNVFDWCNENSIEYKLTKYILPLPIDQRYGEEDMNRIISIVL